jgi:hypothetical protein
MWDAPGAANAFAEYERRMGEQMAPEERALVRGHLRDMASRVGRLIIEGAPDGATILVDGKVAGTAPLGGWFAVEPGRHSVATTAEGVRPSQATVVVEPGEVVRVEMVAGQSMAHTGEVVASGGALRIPVEDPYEPWFWTSVVVTSVAVAALAVTGGVALYYQKEWTDGGGLDSGLRHTGEILQWTTDGLLGLAVASAAIGTWLFFQLAEEEPEYLPGERRPDGVEVGLLPSGLVLRW